MICLSSLFYLLIPLASCTWTTIEVQTTEAFIISLDQLLNVTNEDDSISFRPSLHEAPDLPKWMSYCYSKQHKSGFIYGVPEEKLEAQLDVVLFNKNTYETSSRVLTILAKERLEKAKYVVQVKITNLEIEDMLDGERFNSLLDVLKDHLWPESRNDLYVTFMKSAPSMGYRVPTEPSEKEGVILKLGSQMPFSPTLKTIQEEVAVLYNHNPCPKDFKKASAERYFREANFYVDWCSFKLMEVTRNKTKVETSYENIDLLPTDIISLPSRHQIGTRGYFFDFLVTITVPIILMLTLLIILSFIMCINFEGLKTDSPDIQMVQYASDERASETVRCVSLQREIASDCKSRNVLV